MTDIKTAEQINSQVCGEAWADGKDWRNYKTSDNRVLALQLFDRWWESQFGNKFLSCKFVARRAWLESRGIE